LPETVTVPTGLAARLPANAEPSDIATVTVVTMLPAAALSGRDAVLGVNTTPVGVGGVGWGTLTVIVKVAESLKRVDIPFARTLTE